MLVYFFQARMASTMLNTKHFVIILFYGLLANLPVQAQNATVTILEMRKQVEVPWKAKDWVAVEGLYRQIIATGQAKPPDFRGLAIALSNQGKKQEAMHLKLSTAARPDAETEDHNTVCWGYLEQNKPLDARPYCQRAVDLKSTNLDALVNLGHSWLLAGDKTKAMVQYRKSLEKIRKEDELKQGPLADFDLFIKNGWTVNDALTAKTWFEQGWITLQNLRTLREMLPELARKGQESEAMRQALKAMNDSESLLGDDSTLTKIFARRHVISAIELAKRQIKESPNAPTMETIDSAFAVVGQRLPPEELWGYWEELADSCLKLGQTNKAAALWKRGIAARTAKLGADHPDTLRYKEDKQFVLAMSDPRDIVGDAKQKMQNFTNKVTSNETLTKDELFGMYYAIVIFSNANPNDSDGRTRKAFEATDVMAKRSKLPPQEIDDMKQRAKEEAQRRWREVTRSLD